MKAVILAGGEGTRLRPLSLDMPKPMVPLFGKPVLEHIIGLLRRAGITEIAVTLRYLPQVVTDYFGDGSAFGVSLRYFTEETPLGTAGGVKACSSFLGEEDFLVISGDCVCDFDLKSCGEYHREKGGEVTLLLHREVNPLEYGLVLTDENGQVRRFVEKPAWGQVFTNMVNTGIYLLSPKVLEEIPDGTPWDFSRDLFPKLLGAGRPMYGFAPHGYWCDMGDCRAYLRCQADALDRKLTLDLGLPQVSPGVWSASPLPESMVLVPPCWIDKGVSIGSGALIGPHTVLGAGSSVGEHSLIQHSTLLGASAGERATLYGSILCKNASAGMGAVLGEGTVLGEGASAGENSILREGVKLWPGLRAPQGSRLTTSLTHGQGYGALSFDGHGTIQGVFGQDLGTEELMALGNALSGEERVALGCWGGECARALAQAAASGITAGGARLIRHDGTSPACGAWLAGRYELPVSLFIQQEGERLYLHLFDSRGLPLGRERERKLESILRRSELRRVSAGAVGGWDKLAGVDGSYAGDGARQAVEGHSPIHPFQVTVEEGDSRSEVLSAALEQVGCTVRPRRELGVPALRLSHGGFYLQGWDEEGNYLAPQRLLVLLCMVDLEEGQGPLALPAGAPAAVEQLADAYGSRILRLDRDGEAAQERYAAQPYLRDGLFGACRLCAYLGRTGGTLAALNRRLPPFSIQSQEVSLQGDRGALMHALLEEYQEAEHMEGGLRVKAGSGWVCLAPVTRRPALRVWAEGADEEIAGELCHFFAHKMAALDRRLAEENRA